MKILVNVLKIGIIPIDFILLLCFSTVGFIYILFIMNKKVLAGFDIIETIIRRNDDNGIR